MTGGPPRTAAGPLVEIAGLRWQPATARRPVLDGVDLRIADGERVLLAGASGAGKSTVLRAVAGLLAEDEGDTAGTLAVAGGPAGGAPGLVGFLQQDPGASVVAATAGRDTAFGPENLGLASAVVAERVVAAARAAGFPHGPDRRTAALSGGERQRLALAGTLALGPRLLLLDEPLAMLDPAAAATVHRAVVAAIADRACALVVVDHLLERWLDDVDRLVVLGDRGRVVADGVPGQVLAREGPALAAAGLWVPGLTRPVRRSATTGAATARAARAGATDLTGVTDAGDRPTDAGRRAPGAAPAPASLLTAPASLLTATSVGVRLPDSGWAVHDAGTVVRAGAVTALTGASGAGKSTVLAALGGLLTPTLGDVRADPALADGLGSRPHRWTSRQLAARISWTPQDPADGFTARTAAAEVAVTGRALGRDGPDAGEVARLLAAVGLADRADTDPRRLSGGEQRRLAVVAALAAHPPVLLLDEPTVGQDRATWTAVVGLLEAARDAGTAVVVATHDRLLVDTLADTETVLERADQCEALARVAGTTAAADRAEPTAVRAGRARTAGHRVGHPTDRRADRPDPAPVAAGRAPVAARCSASLLLAAGLLPGLSALLLRDWRDGLLTVLVQLALLLPFAAGRGLRPFRLVPGLVAAASVTWSSWLFGTRDLATAAGSGTRVVALVVPGVLLLSHLDPARLGDELGRWFHVPPRPVLASVAAFGQVESLHEDWQTLTRARRARGLGPGRSPVSRARAAASMTVPLLVGALRRAGTLSDAMTVRGLGATPDRTWSVPPRWSRTDTSLALVTLVLTALPVVTRLT